MHRFASCIATGALGVLLLILPPGSAAAQTPTFVHQEQPPAEGNPANAVGLDSLIRLALDANPAVQAADARVRAAAAEVPQAGARPDPVLMAGVINFPLAEPGFGDFMTMKMIGLSQTFPFPGKLGHRTLAARRELGAAEARARAARLDVVRQVKEAWYDLVQAGQLYGVVLRNQRLLVGLMQATEASYRVGRSGQDDVLRVRVEAARLSDEAAALVEGRRGALARLNALLNRPSDVPVTAPALSARIVRAAVADSAGPVHFVSATPGARVAGSPLPPLDSLQALALAHSPMLEEHEAHIAAQVARVELARREVLPDFDVALQYGQRTGFTDMLSATISIPLPIQAGRKQHEAVVQAEAELAEREAEHHATVNELRARVAELVATLERDRTQLALYTTTILPQARAALEVATAGFQVGRTGFEALLDRQATLFNYETDYIRAQIDFAKSLAALDQVAGAEVLP
jgi:outer membrane protein TolC